MKKESYRLIVDLDNRVFVGDDEIQHRINSALNYDKARRVAKAILQMPEVASVDMENTMKNETETEQSDDSKGEDVLDAKTHVSRAYPAVWVQDLDEPFRRALIQGWRMRPRDVLTDPPLHSGSYLVQIHEKNVCVALFTGVEWFSNGLEVYPQKWMPIPGFTAVEEDE